VTVIDERDVIIRQSGRPHAQVQSQSYRPSRTSRQAVRTSVQRPVGAPVRNMRPGPRRPAVEPMQYRGSGVRMSRAAHRPKQVSVGLTIALAVVSGLITLWLGVIGHFSGDSSVPNVPDRLAVVQVQAGETLERVAGRVAPDLPMSHVMQQIRELNQLESGSLEAGQTLISPIS